MSDTMRAAVLVAQGRIELRDVPAPRPGPDDVLLRPTCVGVCGTDFHIASGEGNYNLDARGAPIPLEREPQILGHEIAAQVLEVGRDVRDLRPGDRVVVDQGLHCGSRRRVPRCEYCASGDSHQCEHYAEHGITGPPGAFAERLVVPATNAVALRGALDDELAALTEPLACVLHALDAVGRAATRYVLRGAPERAVRSVLVAGAGPAGLLFVRTLRAVLGFEGTILVSEPDADKRARAVASGALALDPRDGLAAAVDAHTDGRKVELLIDACGAGALFLDIPGLVRKQATLLLYGHGHGGVDLSALNAVQWREPVLVAPCGASGGFDDDGRPTSYRRALRLLEDGTLEAASLVTHRYVGLDAVPDAFAGDHLRPGYVKGVARLAASG